MNEAYAKPLPQPTIDSKPFWDGLKEHRMVLQKCADCGRVRHYPRPVCDACLSMEVEWAEASGRGTVYSWTETHHPFHAGFRDETPYILVTVDLDEGVRMQSQLIDASIDELHVGLPVEVVYMDATDEVTLPLLRIVR